MPVHLGWILTVVALSLSLSLSLATTLQTYCTGFGQQCRLLTDVYQLDSSFNESVVVSRDAGAVGPPELAATSLTVLPGAVVELRDIVVSGAVLNASVLAQGLLPALAGWLNVAAGASLIINGTTLQVTSCADYSTLMQQICSTPDGPAPAYQLLGYPLRVGWMEGPGVLLTSVSVMCDSGTTAWSLPDLLPCMCTNISTGTDLFSKAANMGTRTTIGYINIASAAVEVPSALPVEITYNLTIRGLPGTLPEMSLPPGTCLIPTHAGVVTMLRVALVNCPFGPSSSFPSGLATAFGWQVSFIRAAFGSRLRFRLIDSVVVLPADEAAWWAYWLDGVPDVSNETLTAAYHRSLWLQSTLTKCVTLQPIQYGPMTAAGQQITFTATSWGRSTWKYTNVTFKSAFPTVTSLRVNSTGILDWGYFGGPDVWPLLNARPIVALLSTELSGQWMSQPSTEAYLVLQNDVQCRLGPSQVLSIPLMGMGDPTGTVARTVFDLQGQSGYVLVNATGSMTVRKMVLMNLPALNSSVTTTSLSFSSSGSPLASLANFTSLLWFWQLDPQARLSTTAPPLIYLDTVTLLLPAEEMSVLADVLMTNSTNQPVDPAALTLLRSQLAGLAAQPGANGSLLLPHFKLFGVAGVNVTLAPLGLAAIASLPFASLPTNWTVMQPLSLRPVTPPALLPPVTPPALLPPTPAPHSGGIQVAAGSGGVSTSWPLAVGVSVGGAVLIVGLLVGVLCSRSRSQHWRQKTLEMGRSISLSKFLTPALGDGGTKLRYSPTGPVSSVVSDRTSNCPSGTDALGVKESPVSGGKLGEKTSDGGLAPLTSTTSMSRKITNSSTMIGVQEVLNELDYPPSLKDSTSSPCAAMSTSPPPSAIETPHEAMARALTRFKQDSSLVVNVQGELGRGQFGVVYKGQWKGLEVAVKHLHIQHTAKKGDTVQLTAVQEAALNASLNHPNIVATYTHEIKQDVSGTSTGGGAGTPDAWSLLIVQEFCDAGSLTDAIRSQRLTSASTPAQAQVCMRNMLFLAINVVSGLEYLHSKNVVHGDLKPDNILLKSKASVPQGAVAKVADFGLSIQMQQGQTHEVARHGTPLYVAPEVVAHAKLSKAADVYSFGIVLWELYHSCMVWDQLSRVAPELARQVQQGRAPAFCINAILPFKECIAPEYRVICLACLNVQPASRPTFTQILSVLCTAVLRIMDSSPALGLASKPDPPKARQAALAALPPSDEAASPPAPVAAGPPPGARASFMAAFHEQFPGPSPGEAAQLSSALEAVSADQAHPGTGVGVTDVEAITSIVCGLHLDPLEESKSGAVEEGNAGHTGDHDPHGGYAAPGSVILML